MVLRRRMIKSSTDGISSVERSRACSTCEFIQLSTARKNLQTTFHICQRGRPDSTALTNLLQAPGLAVDLKRRQMLHA